jgi:hypothetical protein
MSTRANVVIEYLDQGIGVPSELWLYHHHDGYVQGIGETVVRAAHAYGLYVDDGTGLQRLWDKFPQEFENAPGMAGNIEFLYRVTYADGKVTVVARHGGYVGEDVERHYKRANDTPDNSVELYRATLEHGKAVSFRYDIREPESYIRTLTEASQPAARAWQGRLR